MTTNLTHRAQKVGRDELEKSLVEAQRGGGNRDRDRLMAQLAVAERRGDQAEVARIKLLLASESQGKQVD